MNRSVIIYLFVANTYVHNRCKHFVIGITQLLIKQTETKNLHRTHLRFDFYKEASYRQIYLNHTSNVLLFDTGIVSNILFQSTTSVSNNYFGILEALASQSRSTLRVQV